MTRFPNGLSSYGIPVLGGGSIPVTMGVNGLGNVYFVDPTNGNNNNSGLSPNQPLSTIAEAYSRATSNNNDIIALAANASHTVDVGGLTITKNRVNFISLDFHGRMLQQGARVVSSAADTAAYVVKDTGVRNSFVGIKFIQNATAATGLNVFQAGGEGTLFQNCSFTFGVADNLDLTTASEFVAGTDSATYQNCTFGSDTLLTTAARTVFLIKAVNGTTEFKSNQMYNCFFNISSSSATAQFIKVNSTADVLFSNIFTDCIFYASVDSAGGAAITNAVGSVTSLVKGTLAFNRPASFFCTNFCAGVTANVQTYGPVTSAQAGEGGTPA